MKRLCNYLYGYLMEDIKNCGTKGLSFQSQVECSFAIAENYWKRLQRRLSSNSFRTEKEEVEFFKYCKPKFTAEIEYYNLVYHSILFVPLNPEVAADFWRREILRLEKFIAENKEFYEYYKAGSTDQDHHFFLREQFDYSNILEAKVYDADAAATTNGDGLVASIMALEKYTGYAKGELKKLRKEG